MFYPDDPIAADNDRAFDASGATPIEGSNGYDFAEHTFLKPGEHVATRAANVNTIDEVPDSTWFTNRIGRGPMPIDAIVRGPNQVDRLNVDGWPIVSGKSTGITPGYRVADPAGHLYQIKFDPPRHPEMGSGAEVIGAAFYYAIGYNVVQGYIVEIDPDKIVIAPTATTVDMTGRKKRMEREDVDRVLEKAARQPNGRYRAIASRYADGRPLGYFKYYGTRSDDPNDIYLHEHRRELRANRVVAAWLNHDDSRGLNSLDMLEGPEGHKYIRHFMFDFGSIMGSGSTRPQTPRAGNEYILEWKPSWVTFATLGLWLRPWIRVDYPAVARSVGRFEADFFNPVVWKPEYPNPAFDNMQPDDAFWAAPSGVEVLGRSHTGGGRKGTLQRNRRCRVHGHDVNQATGQGLEDLADGSESDCQSEADRRWRVDLRKRRRDGRCRLAAGQLPADLVEIRQHHR